VDLWESPNSPYFGASIAALAIGSAPGGYVASPESAERLKALRAYFQRQHGTVSVMNQLHGLWAASRVPDLITDEQRRATIDRAFALQQPDGGWSTVALGGYKRIDGRPSGGRVRRAARATAAEGPQSVLAHDPSDAVLGQSGQADINVAGVVYWATYGAGSTTPSLGTPVENPGVYHESAPIYFMEKLARPLLALHGTNDRNVPFRNSLRLWDVLLKLGKPFEMGAYPGETHFFRRAHILRDAWRRVEEFFDRHLKHGTAVAPGR
jgi:hypothetical protein